MPQNDQIMYLIHEQQVIGEVDNSVVFCIDTSGSMSSTVEIKKKVNFSQGISTEKNIKQFFEPGDEHQYSQLFNAKNVTPVSRKQRVLAAIEQKITEMKKTNPNKVVGLVNFNNEVVVYGDLAEAPHYCQRSPLQQEDIILEAAQLMSQPTKQQAEGLLKFEKYRRKRQYFWPRILCLTLLFHKKVIL